MSKRAWQVTIRCGGETVVSCTWPSQTFALEPLIEALGYCRVSSVYEAGPFGYTLHDWLMAQGVASIVCSPSQVSAGWADAKIRVRLVADATWRCRTGSRRTGVTR